MVESLSVERHGSTIFISGQVDKYHRIGSRITNEF